MAGPIRISILANASQATAQLRGVSNEAGRVGARFSKLRIPLAVAGGGLIALGGGLLKLAKGAAEDEKAQATLAKQLRNSAGATDAQVKAVEAYISKAGAATGVTDDEMRPAFAALVRSTKDVGKAQTLMGLAMDVSAGTGKDLGAVSLALAKAQNGNVGGLAKLGIATKDAAGKTKSFAQIQADLTKTFAGQSAAAANTVAGKYARVKLTLSELGETIGAKVLPILAVLASFILNKVVPGLEVIVNKLGPSFKAVGAALGSIAGFVGRNQTAFKALAVAVAVVAAATAAHTIVLAINSGALKAWVIQTKIVQVATKAWAAIQWVLNAALSANPIGLIVLAIAALIGIIVLVATKTKFFQTIWAAAWGRIKAAIAAAVGWIKGTGWPILRSVLAGVGTAIRVMVSVWTFQWRVAFAVVRFAINAIVAAVRFGIRLVIAYVRGVVAIAGVFRAAFERGRAAVAEKVNAVVAYLRALPSRMANAMRGAGSILEGVGRAIIQGLIRGIRNMIGRLVGAVKNALGAIPSAAKRLLGIGSPSKVFVKLGRQTIQGYVVGWQREQRRLVRVVAQTAQLVEGGLTPRPSVALAGGGVLVAPAPAPIQINVSVLTGGPEAGRAVVKAIQAYEAERGDRWRR
jgi:hypothetical protein